MGTITERKRKDGTIAYTVQIRMQRQGQAHTEAKTFDRRPAAVAWKTRREKELSDPATFETARRQDPPLHEVIRQYIKEDKRGIGRTKSQVLDTIAKSEFATMACSAIKSQDYVRFAKSLEVTPQTVGNYLSHLAAVVRVARPAWGYPLTEGEFDDAMTVAKRLGLVSRSNQRDRRPTPDELDRILTYYTEMEEREHAAIPMREIIVFAMFSTRRQEEITRISVEDFEGNRVLVRDMKHPGQKKGNDTWCDLPEPAQRVVEKMKPSKGPVFPYNHRSISASFTRACAFLQINDLHFHDLRHEGTSRLFETGLNIPHAAAVTGHRSWASLKRYTHLRHSGDRWKGWIWLEKLGLGASSSASAG